MHSKPYPLIDQHQSLPQFQEICLESQISSNSPSYLNDHRLYGSVVVPAAYYISIVLSLVKEAFHIESCILEHLFFLRPFVLLDQSIQTVQLTLIPQPQETRNASWQVVSFLEEESASRTLYANGKVQLPYASEPFTKTKFVVEEVQARCNQIVSGSEFYTSFWEAGYTLGPSFQWIGQLWQGQGEALCQMHFPQLPDEVSEYQLYPGLIDACFQLLGNCWAAGDTDLARGDYILIPFSLTGFRLYSRPGEDKLWCYAQTQARQTPNNQKLTGDICLFDQTGQVIAEITGLEFRKASREVLLRGLQRDSEALTQPSGQSLEQLEFFQQLKTVPAKERRAYLVAHVRSQVAIVLNLDPLKKPIDQQQGFFDLGIDSITAVELSNRLQTSLECSLSPTLPFDYPTVEAIVDYLAQEVLSLEFDSETAVDPQNVDEDFELSTTLAELSDDEIADLLAQELAIIKQGKIT